MAEHPMTGRAQHMLLGSQGENIAAEVLCEKGYQLLERNWRIGHLEIDLICRDADSIVFVEVKTRKRYAYGGGQSAVSPRKQQRIIRAAQIWLLRHDLWLSPCRFDIVCIYENGSSFKLEHYRDAFTQTLDCSHSYR